MNHTQKNIALFGGSFDPVHLGHLRVARAAAEQFALARVYFVPAYMQPLKAQQAVTSFYHRYAMLTLALEGEARFVPSLLEAPEPGRAADAPSYSVETVSRMRSALQAETVQMETRPPETRLYFLIGMDAFAHIAKWRRATELLRSAEFIVANRPGFALRDVARALPPELRPDEAEENELLETGSLETHGVRLHLLPGVHEDVSATAIRQAARDGVGLEKLVPRGVAEYIWKLKIYSVDQEPGAPAPRGI